jgi:hypothetical protein
MRALELLSILYEFYNGSADKNSKDAQEKAKACVNGKTHHFP